MKIFEIKAKLTSLQIDNDELIVAGNGILEALGIRNSNDADILVSEMTFRNVIKSGYQAKFHVDGSAFVRIGDIDLVYDWYGNSFNYLLPKTILIDDLKFLSLDYTREWKLERSSDKDLMDIELIDDYQKVQ